MGRREQYEKLKITLLSASICESNRRLFKRFLEFEEYKLKRRNGLRELDEGTYKTLLAYISRLRAVNRWFKNRPWRKLTLREIKQVVDDLEDGKLLTLSGQPVKDTVTYYNHIIRSKPFEMAGKRALVEKAMTYYVRPVDKPEVRFITESQFRKVVDSTIKLKHKAFLWLCWDVGENASSILKLQRGDLIRQINPTSSKPEYRVTLRKEVLKRLRTPRTEVTFYDETAQFLDLLLRATDSPSDQVFDFDVRWAAKLLERAASRVDVRCKPSARDLVRLKDLRSSCACNLLEKGFSVDDVKARLGHSPSSKIIDKYANYRAISRQRMKDAFHRDSVSRLRTELSKKEDQIQVFNQQSHSQHERIRQLEQKNRNFAIELTSIEDQLKELKSLLSSLSHASS